MESLAKYANKMIIVIIIASLVIILAGAAIFRSFVAVEFGLGVMLAAILNIAKVLILKYAVERAAGMGSRAMAFTSLMYMLRFVLTGAVLVLAHFLSFVELLGVVFGLLTMPIASYCLKFFMVDGDSAVNPDTTQDDNLIETETTQ